MTRTTETLGALALATALAGPIVPAAHAAEKVKGREIELWTRRAGDFTGKSSPAHVASETLNLDNIEPEQAHLADVQLGRTLDFEGVALDNVLERYRKKAGKANRVLLHFQNGMMIPLALPGDGETTGVFIARAVRVGESFERQFPAVPKKEGVLPEPQPITFAGNKVVIEDAAHPAQPASATASFSPWFYVDSLVGIELVDGKAYERQLEVDGAGPEVTRGLGTFVARCQFCHGARGVGATYGSDVVVPSAMFSSKEPDSLLQHVRLPSSHDKGTKTMPGQKDTVSDEVRDLWAWMKAIAGGKQPPYKP